MSFREMTDAFSEISNTYFGMDSYLAKVKISETFKASCI